MGNDMVRERIRRLLRQPGEQPNRHRCTAVAGHLVATSIGLLVLLACVGCAVVGCNAPPQKVIEATTGRAPFRIPERHFRVPYDPSGGEVRARWLSLGVPLAEMPIIPDDWGFGRVIRITLLQDFLSLPDSRAKAIDSYETTHREPGLEKGMVVLTEQPEKIIFWSHDVLYPASGEAVYFVCARPW